jgi:RNA recognition motif-containing protein
LKNKIIEDLYNDKRFNNTLSKLCKNKEHIEDLKQEVIIILLGKEEKKIIELSKKNLLLYYTIGVIKNQYHSSSSEFYRKFRKSNLDLDIIDDLLNNSDEVDYDRLLTEKIENYLYTEIHWLDAHIFTCYYFTKVDTETGKILKPLSYRQIQDLHRWYDMKIDYNKVAKIVKRTMIQIENKLKRDGYIELHNDKWRINTQNLLDSVVDC